MSFYDDRIEITSPGGLPKGVTEDDYLNKELSLPRNPIIANVFYRMGLIERYGTGVQRIRALYDKSANKPIFKVSENLIKIALPLLGNTIKETIQTLADKTTQTTQTFTDKTTQTTQEIDATTQENITNILKINPEITLREVADKLKLTRDGVKYHITKLQKQGKVKHEGKDNKGKWIVTED